MKNLILIILASFMLTGCSLIPKVNFNTPNTVPQAVDRSKAKEVCRGKAEWNKNGDMVSCSKGYANYAENYEKKERNYTLKEKVLNFFRNLTGNIFWVAVFLLIFFPSLGGWFIGRIFNATNTAFNETVDAIKKFRKTSNAKEELDDILRDTQSKTTKQIIAQKRTE